uniref:Phosphatase tensin-type domain-containing protein n=1 Tax=Meloidogyne javanica TaxID=6303 RepID=A0A915LE08_MELJA
MERVNKAILFHSGSDAIYRNNIKAISERLKKTFLDKYKIFNLSQKRSDLGRANQQGNVLEFGWPEPLAPPLDRLCSICKQLENHLNCSKENVAVIHCKGGIYRAGIVIAAFMNYTNICAGEENLPDRFSMKLFTEKYMEINTQPSHKRILKEYTLIEMPGNKQSLRGDVLLKSSSIDNKACLELAFELSREPRRSSSTPRRGKSSSPRSYQQLSGGDFSRADSYENFERAEVADQSILQENLIEKNSSKNNLNKQQTQDGADSGIGSDSPKVAVSQSILLNGLQQQIVEESNEKEQQKSDLEFNKIITNMPPPVPPKSSSVYKHIPLTVNDGKDVNQELNNQNQHYSPKKHSEIMDGEGEEENDPMRSAFEDSTIGRDHSVLPPGARSSSRRHSPHASIEKVMQLDRTRRIITNSVFHELELCGRQGGDIKIKKIIFFNFSDGGGTSASSGDERPRRRVIISPMVQPQLVASGRYDPNSRCFSYVPAKSLKEHYKAPKKPSLKRRTSVIEPADLEVSPLEAKMALENFGLQSCSSETYRKTETPKWEAEIDKLTGGKIEHRPRRASTAGTPVFEQAKRATPTLLQQQQSTDTRRRPIPGVRPSPRRSEMDALCDPEFYLSYSTPTASPILNKKYPLKEKNVERSLSKSVPDGKEFNQMAKNELQRDDVKELLAQHLIGNNNKGNFNSSVRRSQTPQNPLITSKELEKPLKMDDDYRARNCRSVNSTPLIRNRRLFLYKDVDEPSTDPECAEDWLHSKLQALKGRREPIARNKKEAEKLLLEELKNKATKLISKENEGDPLEEYKKEEQRLKNTKSPFNTEIDGLRKANKFLQNERAKQNFFKQNPSFISSTISKSLPSTNEFFATQRSLSAAPGINNNNFNG